MQGKQAELSAQAVKEHGIPAPNILRPALSQLVTGRKPLPRIAHVALGASPVLLCLLSSCAWSQFCRSPHDFTRSVLLRVKKKNIKSPQNQTKC